MRIAVNTRLLLKDRLEGIGWFTYETLRHIVRQHTEHTFYFLFDRQPHPEFIFGSNVIPVVLAPQARHPVLWYMWFEWSVARFLRKNHIDVFLSLDGYLSLAAQIPQVMAIHDINFYHNRHRLPRLTGWYLNHFTPKYLKKARKVITVSNFSKMDICSCYQIAPEKVEVVYNGVGQNFTPLTSDTVQRVREAISQGQPYFVFVGALNPRKNINGLITAFDMFKTCNESKMKLVIVGEKMFRTKEINQAYKRSAFKDDIILLGRMGRENLHQVVGAALAMVYPSFFEGFGVPVLEAMCCDVPLAVSNSSALPEVAGDAAIYFDPARNDAIAHAMQQLANEPKLREKLVQKGKIQRQKFSWVNSAIKLYDVIENAVNQ